MSRETCKENPDERSLSREGIMVARKREREKDKLVSFMLIPGMLKKPSRTSTTKTVSTTSDNLARFD
jgi:hypothetical protein